MDDKDGTGAGLMEFLAWAAERGEMVEPTARSWLAAVRAVLGIFDDPAQVSVEGLDLDSTLDRFETLNRTKYTSGSMQTYKRRFTSAVAMYLAWLRKDPNWKMAAKPAKGEGGGAKPGRARKTPRKPSSDLDADAQTGASSSLKTEMIPYDLPLRPGLLVRLTLPTDLVLADAERIANFVRSLAFDRPAGELP